MNIIFICGAPRSGTTLLTQLLSGHPKLGVFPRESRLPLYWYSKIDKAGLPTFFNRDYLNTFEIRSLTDPDVYGEYQDYREKIYKSKKETFVPAFDVDKYLDKSFIKESSEPIYGLEVVFRSIRNALNFEDRILVVKMPLETEVFAVELCSVFPDSCVFLHVVRDSRERYISAKMRNKRRGFIVSDENFAIKHASVSMLSEQLAIRNKKVIGERYKIVNYDEMTNSREFLMRGLAKYMDIGWDNCLLEQAGSPTSSFGEPNASDRLEQYDKHTSRSEKNIVDFFSDSKPLSLSDFAMPYNYENPLHYVRNRKQMLQTMRGMPTVVQMRFYHDMIERCFQGEDIGD